MKTKVEVENDVPVRVYHAAGVWVTDDGERRPDEKYVWTHDYAERGECDACMKGTIPVGMK